MKTSLELRQMAATALDEAEAIVTAAQGEKRDLTEDESKNYDAKVALHDKCMRDAERLDGLEARKAKGDESIREPEKAEPRSTITAPKESFEMKLGKRMQAFAMAAGKTSAFRDLGTEYVKEVRATGASEGVAADGGFLVNTEVSNELLKRAHETGKLRGLCRVVPVGGAFNGIKWPKIDESSRVDGSRWGGIAVYRKGEGASYTGSKPTFGEFKLDLEKMTGLFYATDELIADAAQLGAIASQGFAEEFGYKYDAEIFEGTGVGQMLGVLSSGALISVDAEAGQGADTVVSENIMKMYSRMRANLRQNAVWLINQDLEPQLYSMSVAVGVGGIPVYMPANGLSGSPYASLFGRPVIAIEQASAIGDLGDIVFANFSEYIVIEKGGMDQAESMHVQFTTGEMTYRWTMRNNGAPYWSAPLTSANGLTKGEFIALAAR